MMRLAERLGVSLRTLLSDYTRNELNLWFAWMAKEPTEGERIELAVARLAALTHNINSKKQHHVKPKDFMYQAQWVKPKPNVQRDIFLFDKAFGI